MGWRSCLFRVLVLANLCSQVLTIGATCSKYGQFFGGSVSYTLEDAGGKFTMQLQVITGWVLGMGPCGRHCSKASVGASTLQTRLQIERDTNKSTYFGEWQSEVKQPGSPLIKTDITDMIRANMSGKILAVSERSKWEQELMTVDLPIDLNLSHKDINYDGCSWRNLSRQGESLPWHIQAKVDPVKVRSDTNKPNGSPQVLYRPFYRLKLNKESTIKIAATDPDDDYVKCGESVFVESGVFAEKGHKLPGVIIEEDCSIKINTSTSLGFQDQDWAAIVITVRDFNKKLIHFGTDVSNKIAPGMFSLSATAVQFLVLVVANLQEPEFVDPTAEGNHRFILYTDTTWTTDVYARAKGNASLEEFIVIGLHGEQLIQTPIKDDSYRAGVRYISLSWTPGATDIGNHLICVRAVDNTGVDTSEDRCFVVNVGENQFTGVTHPSANKPYFYNLPRLQDLKCDVDSTCVIPIYVKSQGTANITHIRITQMFVDEAHTSVILEKRKNDFKTDLYIKDSKSGVSKICLIATDSNGNESNETCIDSDIVPADPCAAFPCKQSSVCKRNTKDKADYICECKTSFTGKNCDKKKSECELSPCLHGVCVPAIPGKTRQVCQCPPEYGGLDCGTAIFQHCDSSTCKRHGVCRDTLNSSACDCFSRYSDDNCTTDSCSGQSSDILTCPSVPGCSGKTCNGHGVCTSGGVCICSFGYFGLDCQSAKGNMTSGKISIVPPTPEASSVIACYYFIPELCHFSVYFTTPDSSVSHLNVSKQSSQLQGETSVGPITEETNIQGVQKLYKVLVTISKGRGYDKSVGGRRLLCLMASESASHSKDERCFELVLVYNSAYVANSQAFLDTRKLRASVKFVSPTPLPNSRLVCYKNHRCFTFLYTTSNTPCKMISSPSIEVTVQTPTNVASSCQTEVSYMFNTTGDHHICFIAAASKGETRCFFIDVYQNGSDPCTLQPCQNGGLCFYNGTHDSYCVCPDKYTGDRCEKGPCLPGDNTCVSGYCYIDDTNKTCICPIGFLGPTCQHNVSTTAPDPEQKGAVFTDSAVPLVVTCIKNKPCTIPFLLSGNYTTPNVLPHVKPGYVSPSVTIDNIAVDTIQGTNGGFQGHVRVTPDKPGIRHVCLQTTNKAGTNRDELCFAVDVKTDTSTLYGFNELPHFIDPSMPASSIVRCGVGEPCHIVFHVTPGDNHTGECVTVVETQQNFQDQHVFSSCDCTDGEVGTCTPCSSGSAGNNNCSIDVSLTPTILESGTTSLLCLQAYLKLSGQNGEERCINVTVEDIIDHKKKRGCQTLHCKNGGFCDGHLTPPLCYCPFGFTGFECETDIRGNPANTTSLPAILDTGLPDQVICFRNEVCHIPFQVVGENHTLPLLSTGYVDPSLKGVHIVQNASVSGLWEIHKGSIIMTTPIIGSHRICLQTHGNISITTDEKCITVKVEGTSRPPVDAKKPHFLIPSPLQGSTIPCVEKTSCFIELFYVTGDSFGKPAECPDLSRSSKQTIEGLHVFSATYTVSTCSRMLSYIPQHSDVGKIKLLCFQVSVPGKPGEERCFNVLIQNTSNVLGPCKSTACFNGGHCVADLKTKAPVCVCPSGFSGPACQQVAGKHNLQNLTAGLPGAPPPVFIDTAVPTRISCYEDVECVIPLVVHGSTNPSERPIIGFGYVDPYLNTGHAIITPANPTGTYRALVSVTPKKGSSGLHRICTQTREPITRVNVDEICFEVDVITNTSSGTANPMNPKMMSPTLFNNSTLTCHPTIPCHIFTSYTKGSHSTDCPSLQQSTLIDHVLSFPPKESNNTCHVDTVITPTSTQIGKIMHICLHPGDTQSSQCYNVMINKTGTNNGPCQNLHCENNGDCIAQGNNVSCWCRRNYHGLLCGTSTTTSTGNLPGVTGIPTTSPGTPTFDKSSAIPSVVNCVLNTKCQFPVVYHGTDKTQPVLGHVDPNITASPPAVVSNTNQSFPNGTHLVQTTIIPKGPGKVCIQTVDSSKQMNVDEICIDVNIVPATAAPTPSMPHFMEPTLTNGSEIVCIPGQDCHMPIITKPDSNGKCEQVQQCVTNIQAAHIFAPVIDGQKCVSDVLVTNVQSPAMTVCLSSGSGGEERTFTFNKHNKTGFGPCQTLHCENHGFCDQSNGKGFCVCKSGYSGHTCSKKTGSSLVPVNTTGLPGSPPPTFTDAMIPDVIVCHPGVECKIPLTINGNTDPAKKPNVGFGHVDPGISPGKPTVNPTAIPGSYMAIVPFTPGNTSKGIHRVCTQTKFSGMNVDEICFKVDVTPDVQNATSNTTKPSVISPTVNSNSSFVCVTNKSCHLYLTYTKGNNSKCSNVEQTTSVPQVHSFPPTDHNGVCTVDTVFTPTTSQTGQTQICLKPVHGNQKMCYDVKTNDTVPGTGPCQNLHCKNEGICDATQSGAVCICKHGFLGRNCQKVKGNTFVPLPGVSGINITNSVSMPGFDNSSAIPTVVKCKPNTRCFIPVVYHGNYLQPPILGHVDPSISVENSVVLISGAPIFPTDTHLLSTTIKATKPGKVCLQTVDQTNKMNMDEICIMVEIDNGNQHVDSRKPTFRMPTLTNGSQVVCLPDQTCHLPIVATTDLNGTCDIPSLCGTNMEGVRVFEPQPNGIDCVTDVTITGPHAGVTGEICISSGPDGEERIITVNQTLPTGFGPCQKLHCANGGLCEHSNGTAICICKMGYSGSTCDKKSAGNIAPMNSTGLPGVPPPTFTDTAIPDTIVCYQGVKCNIPLTVKGSTDPTKRPVVDFGHIDPGISPGITTVTPVAPSGSYMAVVPFTPLNGSNGVYHVCTQTKDPSSSVNVDEICFKVDVKSGLPSKPLNQTKPNLIDPSVNTNSSFICKPDEACHVHLTYTKGSSGICSEMEQTTSVVQVYPFTPTDDNGLCTVDTVIIPPKAKVGQSQHICLKPKYGIEQTCYDIKIKDISGTGPCRNLHCVNQGICDANANGVTCICTHGFTGSLCENTTDSSFSVLPGISGLNSTNITGGSSFDNSSAIPTIVRCNVNKPCHIPVIIHGGASQLPVLGHVDPTMSASKPTLVSTGSLLPTDTHMVQTIINATKDGKFCLQTVDKSSKINIDEICINVEVNNNSATVNKNKPQFITPTLTNGSQMLCFPGQTCHLPVVTSTDTNGTCNKPTVCGANVESLHVFEPQQSGSICTTEINFGSMNKSATGDICLSPGPGGEQRILTVQYQLPTGFGPCQKLHCENGGTCDQVLNNPVCHCLPDFTGAICDTIITTTTTTTTTEQTTTELSSTTDSTTISSSTVLPSTSESTTESSTSVPSPTTTPFTFTTSSDSTSTAPLSQTTQTATNAPTTTPSSSTIQSTTQESTTLSSSTLATTTHLLLTTQSSTGASSTTFPPTTPSSTSQAATTSSSTTSASTILQSLTTQSSSNAPSTTFPTTTPSSTTQAPTTSSSTTSATTTPLSLTTPSSSNAPSTTLPPTTPSSTTQAPTTSSSTTLATTIPLSLTTPSSSNAPSTTLPPTTPSSTTQAPTTSSSTTSATTTPLSLATTSSSNAPSTTLPPTTPSSTTQAPTTSSSTTSATTIPLSLTTPSSSNAPSTTLPPTTPSSTTQAPTTSSSTTSATTVPLSLTTPSSSNAPSTTLPPTTPSSITQAPTTSSSTTSATTTPLSTQFSTHTPSTTFPSTTSITSTLMSTTQASTAMSSTTDASTTPLSVRKLTTTDASSTTFLPASSTLKSTTQASTDSSSTRAPVSTTELSSTSTSNVSLGLPSTISVSTEQTTSSSKGTCSMTEASKKAREAVKLGRASCYCIINGTKKQIIRKRPVATTSQLVKSAGIGAGASVGTMALASVLYLVVSKLKKAKPDERRRPTPSPRTQSKVHPSRRRSKVIPPLTPVA